MQSRLGLTTASGGEVVTTLADLLSADARQQSRVEANAWIKSLRNVPYDDGVPMRRRFTYRGDSLWWFTELYLHKMRKLETAVSVVLALETACDQESVKRIDLDTKDPVVVAAVTAFAAKRQIPVDHQGVTPDAAAITWSSYQIGLTARLSRFLGMPVRPPKNVPVAAFVHTAFWRQSPGASGPQQESYIGAVLDAVAQRAGEGGLFCVGVGPRRNFRARRWWDPLTGPTPHSRLVTPVERLAPASGLRESLALWHDRQALTQALTRGDAIREAASFHGCDLWPVLRPELEGVAMLQWPWSARAMDEAAAALNAIEPRVVMTYAEAGGWGRALMLEARRQSRPSVGVQHGFIYRDWLNYLHEPDEFARIDDDKGCPIPDKTLVFDRYAEQHLREAGHFPPSALAVTGNARLDQLIAKCNALRPMREALRREFTVASDQPLLVMAAKFSEIRRVLPDLVEAVRRLPGIRLEIKTHPAETPDVYGPYISGIPNISVAPIEVDLARLLTAADALVTMNSTVALDALSLGLPALVIGLPNNLTPFVDAGAMLGANGVEGIRRQCERLLYDAEVRRQVTAAGTAFAERFALASDGNAAARSAEAVLALI
jgi:hypothetical protein